MAPVKGLLPLAEGLPLARRRAVRALGGLALLAILGCLALVVGGAPETARPLSLAVALSGTAAVLARSLSFRTERAAWLVMSSGLLLATVGSVYAALAFAGPAERPVPSAADAIALSSYFCAYIGFTLLLRTRVQSMPASIWLDGLIGGLCVAALGAAFAFEPVLHRTSGNFVEAVTNLVFPVADLVLIALAVLSLALAGWRPGRRWAMLGLAMVAVAVADGAFLLGATDQGAASGALVALLWALPAPLVMIAAFQPPQQVRARTDEWPVLVPPVVFALGALGLLVYGNVAGMNEIALALSAGAVVAAMGRTVLTLREVRLLAESRRQANTDDLTGLPNRRSFQRELESYTREANATGEPLALMLIDLDGFKELNDTLGHHAGDLVLEQLGPRLAGAVRTGDFLARLGGDEFAVLMPGVSGEEGATRAAERVRSALRAGFMLAGMTIHIDASAGIAIFGEHAEDADTLLQRADIAMYQAKGEQAGSRLYDATRDRYSRDRLELTGQLRDAIDAGELVVYFQPKVEMAGGAVVGAEALVRWQHPERGLVPPSEFIPLAEQTGLMQPLTLFVLERSLAACRRWHASGRDMSVAVNVATANLFDREFPAVVGRLLLASGVDPAKLVIEITENSVMTDPQRGGAVLGELRELGVELALDDFGTGYSSLSYLARLPVSELKIDRSFVMDLMVRSNEVIVSAVGDLARNLGLRLVAEGVEDLPTWRRLRTHGCNEAQGFYLARPMPEHELKAWLEAYDPGALGLIPAAGESDPYLDAAWAQTASSSYRL
jgi:diguanylate cyclase